MKKYIIISLIIFGGIIFFNNKTYAYSACTYTYPNETLSTTPCTSNTYDMTEEIQFDYINHESHRELFYNQNCTISLESGTIYKLDCPANNSLEYINGIEYFISTQRNYYFDTSWLHFKSTENIGNTNTIGITNLTPVNNATNVNAYTTFTGTYDNDGTFTDIFLRITKTDNENNPVISILCDGGHLQNSTNIKIGTNLPYTCNFSGEVNKTYNFNAYLVQLGGNLPYPDNEVVDSNGPYTYTTGAVYEVQTPPTSSTCGTLELGCYLENALSWFFGISQNTLNNFNNLTLKNTLPFSYIYDIGNLYNELFNNEPQDINIAIAFGNGSLTLLSTEKLQDIPFQPLVRTVLGAIMIFLTTMFIYRKIIKVHDNDHKTV